MSLPLTYILFYIIGVIIAAIAIRFYNASQRYKWECIPPVVCLFAWISIFLTCVAWIWNKMEDHDVFEKIDKLFKHTDKNS